MREIRQRTCAVCWDKFVGQTSRCPKCLQPPSTGRPVRLGDQLTPRDKQLVELVRRGHANKEIAALLDLGEGTVKVYLSKIFLKTGCNSRLQLALKAQADVVREQSQMYDQLRAKLEK